MQAQTLQKIFFSWFLVLSVIAMYNFYHNVTDAGRQSILETKYAENADRYDESIREHDGFKADLNYLKGRVACQEPTK